jgi:hypothetical protein
VWRDKPDLILVRASHSSISGLDSIVEIWASRYRSQAL